MGMLMRIVAVEIDYRERASEAPEKTAHGSLISLWEIEIKIRPSSVSREKVGNAGRRPEAVGGFFRDQSMYNGTRRDREEEKVKVNRLKRGI